MERDIKEAAFELLYADELQNALMLKCMAQNGADNLQVSGKSVRLFDKSSGNYFFCSEDIGEFETLYCPVKPRIFFLSSDAILEDLKRLHPQLKIHNYEQWIYRGNGNIVTKEFDWIGFRELTLDDLPLVMATQHSEEFDETYFAHRILYGSTICAVEKETGQVLGYFMVHKDGENGPLYVAEKCRNLGMGTELLKRITKKVLRTDYRPLGLVKPENIPAQIISIKVGYERCPKEVLWCYDTAS